MSPDSPSVIGHQSAREQTAQRFSAIGMRRGWKREFIRPHPRSTASLRLSAPGAAACVKMETEPSIALIRPLIAQLLLRKGLAEGEPQRGALQLTRQLCGVLDGAPEAAACVQDGNRAIRPHPPAE